MKDKTHVSLEAVHTHTHTDNLMKKRGVVYDTSN